MIDGKYPILVSHEDGRHWLQLTLVEDIGHVLATQMLTPKGETIDTRRGIIGVPVMIDKKGEVWPRPDKGWSVWCAKPLDN